MPLGFGRTIFSRKVAAGGGGGDIGNSGWWGSQYDGDTTEGAYALIGTQSGSTWSFTGGSTFSVMFWFKGTTADIADSAWTVMRILKNSGSDNSQTVTMTSSGIEPITQNGGSACVSSCTPASFSTNFLDDAWHHCAIEFVPNATKIYLDGVSQTVTHPVPGAQTPGAESSYFMINGTPSSGDPGGGAYNFRASSMQYADFWYKNADNGGIDLASNISSIYSSGWVDLGTDGTAGSVLTTPDVWLYVDSSSGLVNGGSVTSTWTETAATGTGPIYQESASGGPGDV